MKIKRVSFKNYRNVPDMEKELDGCNILLVADNRFGKSNFIKGLLGTLGGNFGKGAIKNGQDRAEIEVRLSDFENEQPIPGTDYTFRAVITKKGEEEVVKWEVMAPNGMRDTKKTVIGTIAGELELGYNFVELSKTKSGKKQQIEIIKSFLDETTRKDLAVFESQAAHLYEQRTNIGRDLKSAQGFIKEAGLNPDDFTKYARPIDIKALLSEKDAIVKKNTQVNQVKARRDERGSRLLKIREQIAALQAEEQDLLNQDNQANEWLLQNHVSVTESLDSAIADAEQHNKMHERVMMLSKKQAEAAKLEENVQDLTVQYNLTKYAIAEAIRTMELPIEGVSFDEETLYYNGKPVDTDHMSQAEIMLFEAMLQMCKAPGAEVVFIQRGESIGRELFVELQSKAKVLGFQLIVEKMEMDTKELKVEFMPDFSKNESGS